MFYLRYRFGFLYRVFIGLACYKKLYINCYVLIKSWSREYAQRKERQMKEGKSIFAFNVFLILFGIALIPVESWPQESPNTITFVINLESTLS